MEDTKVCTKCLETKSLDAFHFENKSNGTRKSRCKECTNADGAAYRSKNYEKISLKRTEQRRENPEKFRISELKYRTANPLKMQTKRFASVSKPSVGLKILVNVAINRDRKKDRESASHEDLLEWVLAHITDNCPCCSVFYDYTRGQGKNPRTSRVPSIDRIDNTEGYTLDNISLICSRCNSLRSNATLDELRNLVAYTESLAKPVLTLVSSK